jgi:phage portal protein BeeE
LPLHVYRRVGDGRERVTSGRLVELLARPGPATSQADLVSSLMGHLAVYGNAYLAMYRQASNLAELGLLHPERVRPELERGRLRFRYTPGTGPQLLLTEADVVHQIAFGVPMVSLAPRDRPSRRRRARKRTTEPRWEQ